VRYGCEDGAGEERSVFDDFFGKNEEATTIKIKNLPVQVTVYLSATVDIADDSELIAESEETDITNAGEEDAVKMDYKKMLFYASIALLLIAMLAYISRLSSYRNELKQNRSRRKDTSVQPAAGWQISYFVVMAVLVVAVIWFYLPDKFGVAGGLNDKRQKPVSIAYAPDFSTSMLAEDITPNRINATVEALLKHAKHTPADYVGLVGFAGNSKVLSSIENSNTHLRNVLRKLGTVSHLFADGAAIGDGLLLSISNLLAKPDTRSYIILFTDGMNNGGMVSPNTAAEPMKALGIRLYIVGIGSYEDGPIKVQTPNGTVYHKIPVEIDDEQYTRMAASTGEKYFRVADNEDLKRVSGEIDAHIKENIWKPDVPVNPFSFSKEEALQVVKKVVLRIDRQVEK
jgi:hypothetical protein